MSISRVTTPARLRVGTPARIDLTLPNQAGRRTPVLWVDDQVHGGPGASALLAHWPAAPKPGSPTGCPPTTAGELWIGPLDLTVGDPLGLTRSRIRATEVTNLVVRPHLIDLVPLLAIAGHDPTADLQPIRAIAIPVTSSSPFVPT